MHVWCTESDDESIWPRKDRVSTYVHRILSWRPPCLFGLSPQSDNEEEEIRERRLIMEELDNLPLPTNNGNLSLFLVFREQDFLNIY